ncbi:ArnT family glycosyltransferase [Solemya velesiana gill symbiont]|uniref:Glycosyltransferase RgtA/B/C/D-like domain-containing protein n=1 Tax=Solemya velesiana gill symbiont TaxID=1918948 RepID=A0A1T2KV56_9GAMM|nr:glycosyltransferase family 39 protein [Solemya velesiana gill symbiont]OOZ36743.1 hypothetical protein BOW51_05580 [Solemya velesiana gill symbiont]
MNTYYIEYILMKFRWGKKSFGEREMGCQANNDVVISMGIWLRRALLITPVVLIIYWWIGEAHEIYGDEATHISLAVKLYKTIVSDGLLSAITFDQRYPPLFYFLSGPFINVASDSLLGGRVFVGIIWLLGLALIYQIIDRLTAEKWIATTIVLLLVGFAPFVEIGRFYLVEGILIVAILAFIYASEELFIQPSAKYLVILMWLLSVGSLVKFNYLLYVFPVIISLLFCLLMNNTLRSEISHCISQNRNKILFSIPLVFFVPIYWYAYQILISKSAVSGLSGMLSSGHLVAQSTAINVASQVLEYYLLNFKVIILVCGLAFFGLLLNKAANLFSSPRVEGGGRETSRSQQLHNFVFITSVIGIILIPVVLSLIGLGGERRWHLEYIYFVLLISVLFSNIHKLMIRQMLYGITYCIIIVLIVNQWISPSYRYIDFNYHVTDWIGRPDSTPVGANDIARKIALDWESQSDYDDQLSLFFFYHEHRGSHFLSVAHYLEKLLPGTYITTDAGAFFNRPIRLEQVLNSDYLIIRELPSVSRHDDDETKMYFEWFAHSHQFFKKNTINLGTIKGRHGVYKILKIDMEKMICGEVGQQIAFLSSLSSSVDWKNYYGELKKELTLFRVCEKYEIIKSISPLFKTAKGWGAGYAKAKGRDIGVVVGPGSDNPNVFAQKIYINPGEKMKIVARASSVNAQKMQGRLQINWFDKNDKYISSSIKIIDVTPDELAYVYYVSAPSNSVTGLLYVTPHGPGDVVRYTEMRILGKSEITGQLNGS